MRGTGTVVAALLIVAACALLFAASSVDETAQLPRSVPAPGSSEYPRLGSPPERPLTIAPTAVDPGDAGTEPTPPPSARPSRPVIRTVEEKPSFEPIGAVPPPPEPLDAEDLARSTLRTARGAFEACYEQSLRKDDKLRGRVVVQVNVQASGRVSSSRIVESTVRDEKVMSCISARLRQLRFPPLGAEVELTVPFSLVPRF